MPKVRYQKNCPDCGNSIELTGGTGPWGYHAHKTECCGKQWAAERITEIVLYDDLPEHQKDQRDRNKV